MIVDNYKIVQEKVAERCMKIGRNPDEVQIIAVSKTQPFSVIRETFQAGVLHFAENKAQELRDKFAESDLDIKWHFVGHLQSNKVKYVVQPAFLLHSIDSIKIVDEVNKKAGDLGKVQDILLEINSSGEASKFGIRDEDEIYTMLEHCNGLPNINFCGFMTMAPYTDNEVIVRQAFSKLLLLKEKVQSMGHNAVHLSMGMTNDYEIAIEEGATLLRIGTAIFGERNYK